MGNISEAITALMGVADQIRQIETEAAEALFTRDDREEYRRKLVEKTILLIELPESLEPFLEGVEEGLREEIQAGIEDFSRRALPAYELSSPFYMSALLYPDDHREGKQNDLEKFIDRIRRKYSH